MTRDWISALEAVPLDWLLEADNPPVRFYTMRDLLDYRADNSELIAANEAIISCRPVQQILKKQNSDGSWMSKDEPYIPKYKSSYWQVMLLAMFGMNRRNPQVESAINHLLAFQHPEGGFETHEATRKQYEFVRKRNLAKKRPTPSFEEWAPLKYREMQMSCLTGNVCLALIRLGYEHHDALKKALQWLVEIQNVDGGWTCPYWGAHKNDKHGCFMGTITPLDAFSEAQVNPKDASMKEAIRHGADFLLMHRLYKSDHHDFSVIDSRWLKICVPQFFFDILRGLAVLTKLGYSNDERIDDALQIVLKKQDRSGKWHSDYSYSGRLHGTIEKKDEPSKWTTLEVLRVIKRVVQTRGHLELNE